MSNPRGGYGSFRILDITRTLEPESAVWPGDVAFRLDWTTRITDGAIVNLSSLRGSPHIGTHMDAPLHVDDRGPSIDTLDLSPYVGAARVVDVTPDSAGLIRPERFTGIDLADPPRILLRTGTNPDPRKVPTTFAALSPETAQLLVESQVVLVGLDTPSVDPADSETLPAHHILLEGGLGLLENLDLAEISEGVYDLIALPLKIRGGDGSPVRAVLIDRAG